jgi:WD40 repeat protein
VYRKADSPPDRLRIKRRNKIGTDNQFAGSSLGATLPCVQDGGRNDEAYDAFISYSHAGDRPLAMAVQAGLQRFAKPWYRRRALRIFRDESSLSATPGLWPTIQQTLAASNYLVLIASPESRHSHWVGQELRYWLDLGRRDRVLLVLSAGQLTWAGRDFDWSRTDAFSPDFQGVFDQEPLYVDLRWARSQAAVSHRDARLVQPLASLAAPIHGRPRDELIGEDLRQHRRTRRTAASALVVISVLAVLAVVGAVVALAQRNTARHNATVAEARAFAAAAQANLGPDLHRSLLYAAAAYGLHDDTSSHAALFQALSSNPHLVRFIPHSAAPTAQTWLGASHLLAEGGQGFLTLTDADSGSGHTVTLPGTVTALASSPDAATVVAATSAHTVTAIDADNGHTRWSESTSSSPVVSLSVDTSSGLVAELDHDGMVAIRHLANGQPVAAQALQFTGYEPQFVGFLNGGSRLVIGNDQGEVELLNLPDLSVLTPWSGPHGMGDTLPPSAYVTDGSSVTFAYSWRAGVAVSTVLGQRAVPSFPAMDVTDTSAFAISQALDEAALDVSGQLVLAQPPDEWHPDGQLTPLTGVSATDSKLAFSADGSLLAGTNGVVTAVWAPRSVSGAARTLPDPLLGLCMACGNAPATLDARDSTIIWTATQAGDTHHLVCATLPSGRVTEDLTLSQESPLALTASADGTMLIGADGRDGALAWSLANGCPSGSARSFATGALGGDHSARVLALKDNSVLIVGENQSVTRVEGTGQVLQLSPPVPPGEQYVLPPVLAAAPDGDHFILGRPDGSVTTYRTAGTAVRKGWRVEMGQRVQGVAYISDTQIAVSTESGDVAVLDAATGAVLHRLAGSQGFAVAGVNGLIVGIGGVQDRAAIWSATDGSLLATINLAPLALPPSSPGRLPYATAGYGTTLLPDGKGMWFFEVGANPTRWDLDSSSWVTTACQQAGRSLTPAEWKAVTGSSAPKDLSCD